MKKLFFIIFLMVFSFAITANAKKPKVVWPKAVLTLKDGTVLNGYLQNDIHFMKKNIYFSETQNGKDVKYKIVDIKSLEVDNALQDGKKRIFILIDDDLNFHFWQLKCSRESMSLAIWNRMLLKTPSQVELLQASRMLPVPLIQVVDHITIWLIAASMFTIGTYLKVKKLIPKEKNTLKRNC